MSAFTPATFRRVSDGLCGDCALALALVFQFEYCPQCRLYWEVGTADGFVWVESCKVMAGGIVGKAKMTFSQSQVDAYLGK